MSNSSIATIAKPEIAVLRNTAASTVVLGAGGTPEILTSGAAQGALQIQGGSTHASNYTAASGEYAVANHGRLYVDMELRGSKAEVAAVMTVRIVAGASGDAAGDGTTIYERTIPAAAGVAEYYWRSQGAWYEVVPGTVLTVQIESDTIADELAITDLTVTYQSIPLRLGAEI